jgi:uncharacterized protein YcbK (DUF882 family)
MLTFKELIRDMQLSDIPHPHQLNLEVLLTRMNKIRTAWNKPMIVTSGYRSMHDHLRIYSQIATKRGQVFDPSKVPMQSNHLKGAAVDISDPDGKLYDWCQANKNILEEVGLWCEEKDDQARVHFQIFPPKSGKRFFKP